MIPENRMVINYGNYDDLVLLTIIDNVTGNERIEDIGFPVIKRYNGITDYNKLRNIEGENKEGFVVRFSNGFRIKLKYLEYIRLHKIIVGISNIAVWELLKEGKSFYEYLDAISDEFYDYIKQTKKELISEFDEILNKSKDVFKILETRKETALYFKKQQYPSVLFSLLDNKKPDDIIWKIIKPKYLKPIIN